jgi:hypothetical protein
MQVKTKMASKIALTILGLLLLTLGLLKLNYWQDAKTPYFNTADPIENVLYAYYSSQGWIAYREFFSNHLPGVYHLLGWWFSLVGIADLTPSLKLFHKAVFYASFLVVLWQLSWTAGTFFILFRSVTLSLIAAAALLSWVYQEINFLVPLSETMISVMFMPIPFLTWQILNTKDEELRFRLAVLLALPWSFFSVWLGLTAAPSSFLVALVSWSVLLGVKPGFGKFRHPLFLGSLLLVLGVGLLSLLKTDPAQMYFFNVPFNKPLAPTKSIVEQIYDNVIYQMGFEWSGREWFMRMFPATLILLGLSLVALLVAELRKRPSSRWQVFSRFAVWTLLILFAAAFSLWRHYVGYKTYALLGINFGLLILVLSAVRNQVWTPGTNPINFKLGWFGFGNGKAMLVLAVILSVTIISFHRRINRKLNKSIRPIFVTELETRQREIEWRRKKICGIHDGPSSDCACVRTTTFNPGDFLILNVKQCQPWGVWIPLFPYDPWSMDSFRRDVADPKVAFVVSDPAAHAMFNVPAESVAQIIATRKCEAFSDILQLCI